MTPSMNLLKLFLLSILLGGAGAVLGAAAGNTAGRGGLMGGGFVVGMAFVVASAYLAVRWQWIRPSQRIWTILGGVFGFGMAWMVALATIATPSALVFSTLLVGAGAVLGAVVGSSPHAKA